MPSLKTNREEHTAGGSPNFKQYEKNPIYILDVTTTARVKYVLYQFVQPFTEPLSQDSPSTRTSQCVDGAECDRLSGSHWYSARSAQCHVGRIRSLRIWRGDTPGLSPSWNLLGYPFHIPSRRKGRIPDRHVQHIFKGYSSEQRR
jgi:hypothetical protein